MMSAKRTSRVQLVARLVASGGLLLGLVGAYSCSKYPTYKDVATDCSGVESEYDLDELPDAGVGPLTMLDPRDPSSWYGSPDYTPDGGAVDPYTASAPTPVSAVIAEGPVCGRFDKAAVFRGSHNNDWGGVFGNWSFGASLHDASGWDGVGIWARAPGPTTKSFTLSLDDKNTAPVDDNKTVESNCRSYGDSSTQLGGPTGLDPSTGTPLSGSGTTRAPYPDECGNSYTVRLQVTSQWAFYPVPFTAFQQDLKPNRVPNAVFKAGNVAGNGLLTSAIRFVGIRMPKEAEFELWVARLAFYKKRP
jgi:hypothetical protein